MKSCSTWPTVQYSQTLAISTGGRVNTSTSNYNVDKLYDGVSTMCSENQ